MNYFKINYEKISNGMRNINCDNVFSGSDNDFQGYKLFSEVVKSLVSKHSPTICVKAHNGADWLSEKSDKFKSSGLSGD